MCVPLLAAYVLLSFVIFALRRLRLRWILMPFPRNELLSFSHHFQFLWIVLRARPLFRLGLF